MVDTLLKYVEEQLSKGYNPGVIKNTLIRQGYSPSLVDSVLESVMMKKNTSPVTTPTPKIIGTSYEKNVLPKLILVFFFLVIIILGVILIPELLLGREALLDIKANPDKMVYEPGEKLGFAVEITNMGSAKKFDTTLIYRLLDANENPVISREETIAISTSMSHYRTIDLPRNIRPGDYTLKIFANYENKVATSSFSFSVKEKTVVAPTCEDGVQNQDETGVDCGGVCGGYWYDNSCHATPKTKTTPTTPPTTGIEEEESCNDGVMNQDETGVDCGGVCGGYWYDNTCHALPKPTTQTQSKPSLAKVLMDAKQKAQSNPEEAKNMCVQLLEKSEEKDKCIKLVAQTSMRKEYCELIIGVDDRDECYLPFFMQGDYSVCEKLRDPQSREACEQLRELESIRQELGE